MTDKTDNKNDDQFDIDKEIESLDDFLSNQKDDDFPDEDDNFSLSNHEAQMENITEKKSGGKSFAYIAFTVAVLGLGYVGVKFAPQFMPGNNELALLEQSQLDRANEQNFDLMPSDTAEVQTEQGPVSDEPVPVSDGPVIADFGVPIDTPTEPTMPVSPELIDTQIVDPSTANALVEENQTISVDEELVIEEAAAETIEEALAIVESAPVQDIPVEAVINETPTSPDLNPVAIVPDAIQQNTNAEFEITEARPLSAQLDLPPVAQTAIDTTNTTMAMDAEQIVEVVESQQQESVVETSTELAVVDNAVIETAVEPVIETATEIVSEVVDNTPTVSPDVQATVVAEEPVSAEPVIETVAEAVAVETVVEETVSVETVKAVPVKQTEIVKPKRVAEPTKPADPRVKQAKSAFDAGDYAKSLSLYEAVLASDKTNTSALTGRQLAQAKLRMQEQPKPMPAQVDKAPVKQTPAPTQAEKPQVAQPAATVQQGSLSTLLSQTQANPKDAKLAAAVGDAYKSAGDKTKAAEWYRRALQLDVLFNGGLDRMSVYDRLGQVQ